MNEKKNQQEWIDWIHSYGAYIPQNKGFWTSDWAILLYGRFTVKLTRDIVPEWHIVRSAH
jgi:hypothetical protein